MEMKLVELCDLIHMPEEVTKEIESIYSLFDEIDEEIASNLLFKETWKEGVEQAKEKNTNPFYLLTLYLYESVKTFECYQKLGIPKKIFIDTFSIFSRFVNEHKVSYGNYGYDREWWNYRNCAMTLFRIGTLEYEIIHEKKEISIHIPSDAIIESTNIDNSLKDAKAFFACYFKEVADYRYSCHSWLLNPILKEFLDEKSHIIGFQERFTVEKVDEDDECIEWVFKTPHLTYEELPEKTSLQRKIKAHLLQGGKVGFTLGYLKENIQ